jgi:hypothetical protein
MIKFTPGKDRWNLGFKEAVWANFQFLQDYGLTLVQSEVTYVRYDSPKVFVNVYHGRGSYELNVEIGRHEGLRKDSPFSLDAVLGWKRAPERKLLNTEVPLFHAKNFESVQELVPKMATLFKKYADPLLKADEESFMSFDNYCTLESHRLGQRFAAGTTRWKADSAFKRKDWKQVIELYHLIGKDLSQTEQAELAYAEQQVLAGKSVGAEPIFEKKT